MDFFKEQDKSRSKTTQLIGLFILAVVAVVLAVYTIALMIMFFYGARQPGFNPEGVEILLVGPDLCEGAGVPPSSMWPGMFRLNEDCRRHNGDELR